MARRSGIEEIVGGIIAIMVLISVASVLFAELDVSSFINKGFFSLLILAMFIALIAKIIEIFKDMF
jgi:uncharacterized MnhB-related membrane protein